MATQKLSKIVQLSMSPRQAKAIDRIDSEDMAMVIYLVKKENHDRGIKEVPEFYDRGCLALKQYYSTTIFDPLNMHAIDGALDPFWHAHLLDTVRYKLLCDDIGAFMHHDPLNQLNTEKVEHIKEVYNYTYDVLAKIFGAENLDHEFYPAQMKEARVVCRHDVEEFSYRQFNDVMPVNDRIHVLREKYGHAKQRELIERALRRIE